MTSSLARAALWCGTLLACLLPAATRAQLVSPELAGFAALAGAPPAAQHDPAAAFDGAHHLVVWVEGSAVLAALVDRAGVVSSGRIAIASSPSPKGAASVAATSAGFLVAWPELLGEPPGWRILAARVDGAGAVLDAGGIPISAGQGAQEQPAVASDGTTFLVAWTDSADPATAPDVRAARVSGAGVVLDPGGVPVAATVDRETSPRVASTGAGFLVTWRSGPPGGPDAPWAAAVDGGAAGPALALSAAGGQGAAEVAASGAAYAALWAGGDLALVAARLAGGAVLDPAGLPVAPAIGAAYPHALGGDRDGWLAALEGDAGAEVRRIHPSGALGPVVSLDPAPAAPGLALSSDGAGRYLAVYREDSGGVPLLAARLVDVVAPVQVSRAGTGVGSVASEPAGIACGATCAAVFPVDTTVTLVAAADPGSTFAGWSGCAATLPGRCELAAGATSAVTATFALELPGAPGTPSFDLVGTTSLRVSWTPGARAATHDLERAPGPLGPWSTVATGLSATTHVDAGLSPGASTWYRVVGRNAEGAGAPSPAAEATTLPLAPAAPTFGAITTGSITVQWGPASGAAGYELQTAAAAGGPWTVVATGLAGTSHVHASLPIATVHWYRVLALNAAGAPGAASLPAQTATLPAAPAAPALDPVGATSIAVSWGAVAGATGYRVERAPDVAGAEGTYAEVAQVAASPRVDAVAPNTRYWYRVRAVTLGGAGAASPGVTALTLPGAPGGPTFPAAGLTTLSVSWSPPTNGADRYDLDRATSSGGPWSPLATGTTATSHADAGLAAGTQYFHRVRAWNAAGAGAWATASRWTLPDAPGAPTFGAITTTTIAVQWSASPGATGYQLERAPDVAGAPGTWQSASTGAATTWSHGGLTANTTVWYRVRATNASGAGPWSPQSSTATLPNAPGAPTFSELATTSVRLTWTAPVGGAASYDVERAGASTGPWQVVGSSATTTWADAGLAAGATYFYRLVPRSAGGAGLPSPFRSVTTIPLPPQAPGAPTFSGISTVSLTVRWAPVAGATSYQVERALDAGGPWQTVALGLRDAWWNDAVAANTTYWYRVRAVNGGGDAASPAAAVTTRAEAPAAAPTFGPVGATAVTVRWSAPASGAEAYELYRARSSGGPWTLVAGGLAAVSYADTGLLPGTTYWYRVRPLTAGGAGPSSPAAAVRTLASDPTAAPGAPGAPAYLVLATSIRISWAAASPPGSYTLERAPDAGAGPGAWQVLATGLATTTFTAPALAPGAISWFRVRATNGLGDGPWSAATSVVAAPGAPGAPSFSAVTTTTLQLSWAAPAGGAATYSVERGPAASGPWTVVASAVAGTSLAQAGLAPHATYWYRLRARSSAGAFGPYSPAASVTTAGDPSVPVPGATGAPTFPVVSASSISVRWAAATGATRHDLERAPDAGGVPGPWARVASGLATPAWVDQGLGPNVRLWYRARGTNGGGAGAWSEPRSAMTAPASPGVPLFSDVATTSLVVSWGEPAGGASRYALERAPAATGPWTVAATGLTSRTATQTGLVANTTHYYRVRAVNADGTAGASSISRSVRTALDPAVAPPAAPAGPTYSGVTAVSLVVSWPSATGSTAYKLFRAPDLAGAPGGWALVATTTSAVRTFADLRARPATTYWYRVCGSNAGGDGPYSAATSVTTLAATPATPSVLHLTPASVTLGWSPPPGGASGYAVERALAPSGAWAELGRTLYTAFADRSVAPATTYLYRVRAVTGGVAGPPSPARTVTTPSIVVTGP